MSLALEARGGFLDAPLRAALLKSWRQALLGTAEPETPTALPPPWPALHRQALQLLVPWRGAVAGRPEAAERVLELLVARLHKASWAALASPEHPRAAALHQRLQAAEASPPSDLDAVAPELLEALCAGAAGGYGRFGALLELSRRAEGQSNPGAIDLTENAPPGDEARQAPSRGAQQLKREALHRALFERWREALSEEVATFEAEQLSAALRHLAPELRCRREALARITRLLGVGLEGLAPGGDWSSGFWHEASFEALESTAARLEAHPSLTQLAELIGRWEGEDQAQAAAPAPRQERALRPSAAGRSEVVGLHFSGELDRLTAADLTLLSHPDTELLFYARYLEQRLLTYEMRGPQWYADPQRTRAVSPGGRRGPVVLCLDTSASMQGAPELLAKALSLAVLKVALRARRPCFLLHFSSANDLRELELSRFPAAIEPLMDLLAGSFHGGTDPRRALERALERASSGAAARADLLLVTDGLFELDPPFLERFTEARRDAGVRVGALLIGDHGPEAALGFADATWRWREGEGLGGPVAWSRSLHAPAPD